MAASSCGGGAVGKPGDDADPVSLLIAVQLLRAISVFKYNLSVLSVLSVLTYVPRLGVDPGKKPTRG